MSAQLRSTKYHNIDVESSFFDDESFENVQGAMEEKQDAVRVSC